MIRNQLTTNKLIPFRDVSACCPSNAATLRSPRSVTRRRSLSCGARGTSDQRMLENLIKKRGFLDFEVCLTILQRCTEVLFRCLEAKQRCLISLQRCIEASFTCFVTKQHCFVSVIKHVWSPNRADPRSIKSRISLLADQLKGVRSIGIGIIIAIVFRR